MKKKNIMRKIFFVFIFIFGNSLFSQTTHFKFKSGTVIDPAVIAIPFSTNSNVNGVTLVDGDEIGVFNGNGLCCGGCVWHVSTTNSSTNVITAWGDNPQSQPIDGFLSNNNDIIYFRIWVKKTPKNEYYARVKYKTQDQTGFVYNSTFYYPNGIYVLDSLVGYKLVKVESGIRTPNSFYLYQNFPNPFNPSTIIKYDLSISGHVELEIFNLSGNKVIKLLDEEKSPGSYSVFWDGRNMKNEIVAQGIYFYRLKVEDYFSDMKKLIFIK